MAKKEVVKEKEATEEMYEETQYDYLLSLIDIINESIKTLHQRLDGISNEDVDMAELKKMVDRIANRMGLK